jgi:osmotically-inducible protein OsmY
MELGQLGFLSKRKADKHRSFMTRWSKSSSTKSLALAAAGGAVAMYLADPDRGLRRRKVMKDRALASVRKGGRRAGRTAVYLQSTATGKVKHALHARDEPAHVADDQMLTDRVLSMAFRELDIDQGGVNVNTERGIVVLRGVLDQPEDIRNLEQAVGRVPGVQEVISYLHLPDTDPPSEIARHFKS